MDANWNPTGAPGGTLGSATNGDTATFNGPTAATTVNVDSGRNIDNIVFTPGTKTLAYTFTGGPLVLTAGGSIVVNATGTSTAVAATFSTPVTLEGNYSIINNGIPSTASFSAADTLSFVAIGTDINQGNINLTFGGGMVPPTFLSSANLLYTGGNQFTGVISNASGTTLSLVKTGPADWVVRSANTYSGSTTLDGGIFDAVVWANGGTASSLGSSSNAASNLIFNGGDLMYSGFSGGSGGSSLTSVSTDRLFTIGDATGSGNSATIDNMDYNGSAPNGTSATTNALMSFTNTGAIVYGSTGPHSLTLQGENLGNNMFDLNITDDAGGDPTSLNKAGSGTWVLGNTVTNTYSGPTTITGGVLRDTNGIGLSATSLLNLDGGTYETSINFTSRSLGTGSGNVEVTGGQSGFSANGGPVTVTIINGGNPLQFGTQTFNPSELILNQTTATNAITLTNNLDLNGGHQIVAVNANTATISGSISNSGPQSASLSKQGLGTLNLTNANSYDGGTTVAGGVLNVTSTGTLGTGNASVYGGAELRLSSPTTALAAGKTVSLNNATIGLGADVTQSALNTLLAPGSTGVVALNSNQTDALNMGTLGSGRLYLGSSTGGTYSASSLTVAGGDENVQGPPNNTLGGTYLLGGGGGTLTITGSNVLTDQTPVLLLPNVNNTLQVAQYTTTGTEQSSATNTRNSVSIGDSSTAGQPGGGGTVDLRAAQNYTGYTTINTGGKLVLDYSTSGTGAVGNMVSNSSPVIMRGGTLSMVGGANATNTQSFDNVNINAGNSTITTTAGAGGTSTLNLGNLTLGNIAPSGATNTGSTLLINPGTGTTITENNAALFGPESSSPQTIGNGAIVYNNGTSTYSWAAATNTGSGPYTITGLTGETNLTTSTVTNATTDYQIAANVTPTGSETMNLLRATNAGATTLALGNNLLSTNGILYNGAGAFAITGNTNSQGLTSSSGMLYVYSYGTGNFTISSGIVGNTGVVYGGTGNINLAQFGLISTYTGNTYIDGATLTFAENTSPFGNGNGTIIINSGTLLAPSSTSATNIKQNVQLNGNFTLGKSAGGQGTTGPSFNGTTTLTNNITITVNTGGLGGWTFGGTVTDGGYGYGINIAGNNPNPSNPALPYINGPLVLSGTNTFTGAINVLGDSVNFNIGASINAHNTLNMAANTYAFFSNATYQLAGINSIGSTNGSAIISTNGGRGYNLVLNGNGNYYFDGTLQDGTSVSTLTMQGAGGTQTLAGNSTFTGAVTAGAGTLILDASQGGALTGTNNALTMAGGTFEYKGAPTGTSTQKLGTLTVNSGDSTLLVDGNGGATTLAFTGVTASAVGGTLDIVTKNSPTITTTAANNSAGTLGNGGHIVYTDASGNTTWATAATASGGVIGAYTGDTTPLPTSGGTTGTTTAYNLTGSQQQTGSTFAALLRISNTSAGSLDLNGKALEMNQDGVLFNGTASYSITDSVGTGTMFGAAGDKEVIFQNYGSGAGTTLTLGATITNNNANATALTIAGPGTTILTSTNSTFSGGTVLNGPGIVNFDNNANFGSAGTGITFNGATLQYATGNTLDLSSNRTATFNPSGGTIDTNGNNITYGAVSFGTGVGSMTLVDSAGGGVLNFNTASKYTGNTIIRNGGDLVLGASGDLSNGSSTIVGSGGTLQGGMTLGQPGVVKAGTLVLQSGGVIAPGAGLGIQQIQNVGINSSTTSNNGSNLGQLNVLNATTLTFNPGGTIKFELDNNIDQANGAGTSLTPSASTQINLGQGALVKGTTGTGAYILDFGNTGTYDNVVGLAVVNGNVVEDGGNNVYDLINFGGTSLIGGLDGNTNFNIDDFSIRDLSGIGVLSFWYNASTGQEELLLTVVPEPSTWAMMICGLAILIVWTTRRRPNRKSKP